MIACNTATSIGEDVAREVAATHGVEVVPVVEPQAEIAAAITDSGRVGVLATPNTVESGAYRRALEEQGRSLAVTEVEAPELAPFIQDGSPFDAGVLEMARAYCVPLKRAEVDTLILGCTHYPLVAPMLQRILGRDVRLVSGGHAVAAAVQRTLERRGLARAGVGEGAYRFLCTGDVDSFCDLGTRFLQMPLGEVERVDDPGCRLSAAAKNFTVSAHSSTHACAGSWNAGSMTTTAAAISSGNTVYTHPVAKVMISIPDSLLERLDAQARADRETRSGFLRRLAERELESADSHMRDEVDRLLSEIGPVDLGGVGAAQLIREDRESH